MNETNTDNSLNDDIVTNGSEEVIDSQKAINQKDNITAEIVYERKVDNLGRAYATGKRKNAVARVWIKAGNGKILVNGREFESFFARPVLRMVVEQPLKATANNDKFDINCTVSGGGLSGQAGAIRHGLSKALVNFDPEHRPTLKSGGFLTRDSRVVERKKYGRAKARKSYQFSKR